jgi:mono/diheme cytochrome c family protein
MLVISAFAIAAFARSDDAKPAKKKLTGEQLYAINCNRCHAERYPTERTDAQWKTVMLHMRTRAQIPSADAKAILKYLQENN